LRDPLHALAKKAVAVGLGRAPWAKETIAVSRQTILARLVCSGLPPKQVRMSGAQAVVVSRNEKVVKAAQFLEATEAYLATHRPGPTGCRWRLCYMPKDLVIPAKEDIKLRAEPAGSAPEDHVKVRVAAVAAGREVGSRELLFKLVYPTQQAVTTKEILAGGKITKENTMVKTVFVNRRPAQKADAPYGMLASHRLPPGTVLRPGLLRETKPPIVVRQNQSVVMCLRGLGFVITAVGRALQEGRAGDLIRIRNVDTNRIITAKVAFDGTVEPVLRRVRK